MKKMSKPKLARLC